MQLFTLIAVVRCYNEQVSLSFAGMDIAHCKEHKLSSIKIFCISLVNAKARRESILEMKNNLDLNLEIINAIDGRNKSRVEMQSMTKRRIRWNCLNGHRDEMKTPTEAACSLSHISVWEKIINKNLEHAIIIEDDVISQQNATLNIARDADFVYLSPRANRDLNGKVCAPIWGSEAYYLTNTCAAKLLEIYQELRMPVDIQWLPQMENLIQSGFFLTAFTDKNLPTLKAYALPNIFTLNNHHHNSQIREQNQGKALRVMAPITISDLVEKLITLQKKLISNNNQLHGARSDIQEFAVLQQRWRSLGIKNDPILSKLIGQFIILKEKINETEAQLLDESLEDPETIKHLIKSWREQKFHANEIKFNINKRNESAATKKADT